MLGKAEKNFHKKFNFMNPNNLEAILSENGLEETFHEQLHDEPVITLDRFEQFFRPKFLNMNNIILFNRRLNNLVMAMYRKNFSKTTLSALIQFCYSSTHQVQTQNLTALSQHEVLQKLSTSRIKRLHNQLHQNFPKEFLTHGKLRLLLETGQMQQHIQSLMAGPKVADDYDQIYSYILTFGCERALIKDYIASLPPSKCELALRMINKFQFPIEEFVGVLAELSWKKLRYLKKTQHWLKVEELLSDKPKQLLKFVSLISHDPLSAEIVKRHDLPIKDRELQVQLDSHQTVAKGSDLWLKDDFLPTEIVLGLGFDYLKCTDFGYSFESMVLIEDAQQLDEKTKTSLLGADLIGLDTESSFHMMDDFQNLCMLQLATEERVYVFNLQSLKRHEEILIFLVQLLESKATFVAQGVAQDLKLLSQYFKKQLKLENCVELTNLFRKKYPNEGKSALDYQVSLVFKKKLSKFEQLSLWEQRPLRKSQIHYAALDAIACIQLYKSYSLMP